MVENQDSFGWCWWWRVRRNRARLVVVPRYQLIVVVLAMLMFWPASLVVAAIAWWGPLVIIACSFLSWRKISIDDREVHSVHYLLVIPRSKQSLTHPVCARGTTSFDTGKPDGIEFESVHDDRSSTDRIFVPTPEVHPFIDEVDKVLKNYRPPEH